MPPQKRSKKNIPPDSDQEDHHHLEGNEISFVPEPSNIKIKNGEQNSKP
jgi:hypothetical protein